MKFGFNARQPASVNRRRAARRSGRRDTLHLDRLEPRQMLAANAFSGTVMSGVGATGQRQANALVTLWEATDAAPNALGTATSRRNGTFHIANVSRATTSGIFYVTADLGGGVSLTTVLGSKLPKAAITVNELTTVAAGYSMTQFCRPDGGIGGDTFGLRTATAMNSNLVSAATGGASSVLLSSPNRYETNSLRTLRSLGNLTAAMVRSRPLERALLRSQFFAHATPPNGTTPDNVFEAFAEINRHPDAKVAEIYGMTRYSAAYADGLFQAPDAFTLTVVVNNSGSRKNMIAGPAQLVFDDRGTAWVTNNFVSPDSPNSSKIVLALQPNGAPATNSPKSPISGGGTLGQAFGIAIDPTTGNIWATNYGWGNAPGNKPGPPPAGSGTGSVSVYSPTGVPLSGPQGLYGFNPTTGEFPAVKRAQGIQVDSQGNVYIASIENDSVVVFPKGDSTQAVSYKVPDAVWQAIDRDLNHFQNPFDVRLAADDSVWVSFSGDLADVEAPGGFVRVKLNGSPGSYTLDPLFTPVAKAPTHGTAYSDHNLRAPKGMVLDSLGNCWITSGPSHSIYKVPFDWNDTMHPLVDIKRYSGGGISGPWGLEVDGADNIWVANFGPEGVGAVYTKPAISVLAGANAAKRPQGYAEGQPISSAVGYTVPTGGQQVRMANGNPIYGKGMPASYLPLQRLTQVRVDQGGNMWCLNNWKPDFTWDATGEVLVGGVAKGGGGNAIVIFVGTTPPKPRVRTSPGPQPITAPAPYQNAFMAANNSSSIHKNAAASDTVSIKGPATNAATHVVENYRGPLPDKIGGTLAFNSRGQQLTIFSGPDATQPGYTAFTLALMDPATGVTLDQVPLPNKITPQNTSFAGGGYFYLDEQDRVVCVTANQQIRVYSTTGNRFDANPQIYDLAPTINDNTDILNSVVPDSAGRMWFVTKNAQAGYVTRTGDLQITSLRTASNANPNETNTQSFSTDSEGGVYVVTDYAQYRLDAGGSGAVIVTWRTAYDRGTRVKPGQVSQGSGTTPTCFDDANGNKFVAITDNADPFMHVNVYNRTTGQLVASQAVFQTRPGENGTENSLIAVNNSLIVENNYGNLNVGSTVGPLTTKPGVERVDFDPRTGQSWVRWSNTSVAVPSVVSILSTADGLIYSYAKDRQGWYWAALDYRTGSVYKRAEVVSWSSVAGGEYANNYYSGISIGPDGTAYVSVFAGIVSWKRGRAPVVRVG